MSKYVKKNEVIHAIDINEEAVKSVDINKNILGLQDKIRSFKADINRLASMKDEEVDAFLSFHK